MAPPPDVTSLEQSLRRRGMPRADARRMAREWHEHHEDIASAAARDGVDADAAERMATEQLGTPRLLIESLTALPHITQRFDAQQQIATACRWGGACVAGSVTTLVLFAALNLVLGL